MATVQMMSPHCALKRCHLAAMQHLCLEARRALADQHQAGEGVAQAAEQGRERFQKGPKLLHARGPGVTTHCNQPGRWTARIAVQAKSCMYNICPCMGRCPRHQLPTSLAALLSQMTSAADGDSTASTRLRRRSITTPPSRSTASRASYSWRRALCGREGGWGLVRVRCCRMQPDDPLRQPPGGHSCCLEERGCMHDVPGREHAPPGPHRTGRLGSEEMTTGQSGLPAADAFTPACTTGALAPPAAAAGRATCRTLAAPSAATPSAAVVGSALAAGPCAWSAGSTTSRKCRGRCTPASRCRSADAASGSEAYTTTVWKAEKGKPAVPASCAGTSMQPTPAAAASTAAASDLPTAPLARSWPSRSSWQMRPPGCPLSSTGR